MDGEQILFRLADCPVVVSRNRVALVSIPMSKLILQDTIVRGDEETGYFEGDKVFWDKSYLGRVIYEKGFRLQDKRGNIKDIPWGRHLHVEKGSIADIRKITKCEDRTPINFKYKDTEIDFYAFLCKIGNFIAVNSKTTPLRKLDPDYLMHNSGIKSSKGTVFLGDLYNGGLLTLHHGVPCVKKDGRFFRVESEV